MKKRQKLGWCYRTWGGVLVVFFVYMLLSFSLFAQTVAVVATVDDTPITETDLNDRLGFIVLTSGLPNTGETRKNLRDKVLQKMIDERLQILEAMKYGIVPTRDEVHKAIRAIEQREGMALGSLLKLARENKIPDAVVEEQVRAGMVWGDVVARAGYNKDTMVSDAELDAVIRQTKAQSESGQVSLSEIFFPVEGPAQEEQVRADAEKIIGQLKKGANFGELARLLSKSASAAQAGFMGRVMKGALEKPLEEAIAQLPEGQVSKPIRGQAGFYILLKNPSDKTVFSILQIAIPVKSEQEAFSAAQYIEKMRASPMPCAQREKQLKAENPHAQVTLNENVSPHRLNAQLLSLLKSLKREEMSQPINAGSAILSMGLCQVQDVATKTPEREEIRSMIANQKMSLISQRLMRDLRRERDIHIIGQ